MSPISTCFAPLLLSLSVITAPGDPISAPPELRIHDLSPMLSAEDEGFEQRLYPFAARGEELFDEAEVVWTTDPEMIAALVKDVFAAEFEYADRGLYVRGHRLLVAAPPDVQESVAAFLAALEERAGASTEIAIDVFELPLSAGVAVPARSLLADREALPLLDALGAAAERHQSFRMRLAPGRTAALDATRAQDLVTDYDVEVAQGAFVFDPIIDQVAVGTRLLARATPITGGLSLSLLLQSSEIVAGPFERQLASGGMVATEQGRGRLEIGAEVFHGVDVLGHNLALDTALPDGHALVLEAAHDLGAHLGRRVFVLRRTGAALSPASAVARGDGWALVAVSREAAVPPHVALRGWPLADGAGLPATLRASRWDEGLLATIESDAELPELFGAAGTEGTTTAQFGAWQVTAAGGDSIDPPRSWSSSPDLVDVRVALRAGGDSPREAASITLPVRAGESGTAVLGIERNAINDFDVEIAQYSAVADPVASTVFDGLLVHVRPSRLADGRIAIEVRARGHLRAEAQRRAELDSFAFDAVELDVFDRLFVDERVVVTAGGEG